MEFHRPGGEIYKSSGLPGKTPPTRTSKAFKLFQRNFHGLQNGLRSKHGQKIIYRDFSSRDHIWMFSKPRHSTSDEEIHDVFKWAMDSCFEFNWHLNGVVFFLTVRMATPFWHFSLASRAWSSSLLACPWKERKCRQTKGNFPTKIKKKTYLASDSK